MPSEEDLDRPSSFWLKKSCRDAAPPVFVPVALTNKTIHPILCKKHNGQGVFRMVDYQPIADLVKQIPADTWKILQEIQKRRPAMMLHELLDQRECEPKPPPNAQARKVS